MPTRSRQTVARALATITSAVLLTAGSGNAFADDTNTQSAVPTSFSLFPAFLTSPIRPTPSLPHTASPASPPLFTLSSTSSTPEFHPAHDHERVLEPVPVPVTTLVRAPANVVNPTASAAVPPPDASGDATTAPAKGSGSMMGHFAQRVGDVVTGSLSMIGVRYRWGGTTPASGLDCSGFVRYVFQDAVGLQLPRRAEEMAHTGQKVALSELRPGDLVFFNTMRRTFSHVGIYLGNNRFIHAPRTGEQVRIDALDDGYWEHRFTGARRVAAVGPLPAGTDDGAAKLLPAVYNPQDNGAAAVRVRFSLPGGTSPMP